MIQDLPENSGRKEDEVKSNTFSMVFCSFIALIIFGGGALVLHTEKIVEARGQTINQPTVVKPAATEIVPSKTIKRAGLFPNFGSNIGRTIIVAPIDYAHELSFFKIEGGRVSMRDGERNVEVIELYVASGNKFLKKDIEYFAFWTVGSDAGHWFVLIKEYNSEMGTYHTNPLEVRLWLQDNYTTPTP
ncbi:MAG: hypothetical protein CEN90_296 [Parcubacteria group bacterium Licking1014_17]|nr:MAG: hypothetical protein CEN90_296 [Parcubacteria group bacterium Licking1014_17]